MTPLLVTNDISYVIYVRFGKREAFMNCMLIYFGRENLNFQFSNLKEVDHKRHEKSFVLTFAIIHLSNQKYFCFMLAYHKVVLFFGDMHNARII